MPDPIAQMAADRQEARVVIRLSGEVDFTTVEALRTQIENAVAEVEEVIIDLTAVEFLDSGGLRLLHQVESATAGRSQSLVVVAPPTCVARSVLDIAGMKGDLAVRDTLPSDRRPGSHMGEDC